MYDFLSGLSGLTFAGWIFIKGPSVPVLVFIVGLFQLLELFSTPALQKLVQLGVARESLNQFI